MCVCLREKKRKSKKKREKSLLSNKVEYINKMCVHEREREKKRQKEKERENMFYLSKSMIFLLFTIRYSGTPQKFVCICCEKKKNEKKSKPFHNVYLNLLF